jgi:hypothetical protein
LQEKVYEEMTRIFDGSDRQPTKEDLEQMKYLERVIKETLRLYPSGFALGRVTETDVQIGELQNVVSEGNQLIYLVCFSKAKLLRYLIVGMFLKTSNSIPVFSIKTILAYIAAFKY